MTEVAQTQSQSEQHRQSEAKQTAPLGEPEVVRIGSHESWFHSLSSSQKRFHVLFYALAGLTGLLVVQLIWQIAVATAK